MYSIGIDIGCSAVKTAVIKDGLIIDSQYVLHHGGVKDVLQNSIQELLGKYSLEDLRYGAVTGGGSSLISQNGPIRQVNEAAAIIEGCSNIRADTGSIIEIGGQSAKFISPISQGDKSRIGISVNSSCSAGTGSFLEEQMSRLNLSLTDYSEYASRAQTIPRIAGRCSVFAKTDIIHHQQEGVAVEDILLGLAYALVKNYKGAVIKRQEIRKPLMFIGGVAHNQAIVTALKDVLDLSAADLIVPEHFAALGAAGAAIMAEREKHEINLSSLLDYLKDVRTVCGEIDEPIGLPCLAAWGENDSRNKHVFKSLLPDQELLNCYLGIDIGSTSTNLVIMNEKNEIIGFKYLRTLGDPVAAVDQGLQSIKGDLGERINIIGVGVTGSGRYMIGELIGADVIKDEITAQAKAAVTLDKEVDTIFEIGGQDSKYIELKNGMVTDFQMNKICAAGTGSFIEEQANKLDIPLNSFGDRALGSKKPSYLGERCTVFIETSIAAQLAEGAELNDIAAGLCYSIVKNYLNRVVGSKKIGKKILFQGGVAYNQGVVNAFRALLGDRIHVPPFFSVSGAYGAAILAQETMTADKTSFKGFNIDFSGQLHKKKPASKPGPESGSSFAAGIERLIFAGYDSSLDPERKTVGIPRALFTYGMFPMFYSFFKELGFNVIMSNPSSEETIRLAQEYSLDETCYPVKLVNGHVAELLKKHVDYLFFPDLYTVDHPGSESRQNYGCAYMQLAFKMVNQAMNLEKKGVKLLAPTIAFNLGKEFMLQSFAELGEMLGKSQQETTRALQKSMLEVANFEKRMEENGREVVAGLREDEICFVLISKTYGVADPVLNLGIPDKLRHMGYQVISFFDLPESDIFEEHPNMYWPFGQHILEAAQTVKQNPNLYAIFLTHHGCGPDTVLSHYFREIMGQKPYLHIEVDEHSSEVGVITRVEAFVNSLNKISAPTAAGVEVNKAGTVPGNLFIRTELDDLKKDAVFYLPNIQPYSPIFQSMLRQQGIITEILPPTSSLSIDMGRRHTMTNEYFSLTALWGDILCKLNESPCGKEKIALLIPQTEGTEVEGQYHRWLRMKLDEEGYKNVAIIAPFLEDAPQLGDDKFKRICWGLLAGDLIRLAAGPFRPKHLQQVLDLIDQRQFQVDRLQIIAGEIYRELKNLHSKKRILALGEPLILFNDILNQDIFNNIEEQQHRVIYGSMSEAMWLFWQDHVRQNPVPAASIRQARLDEFRQYIHEISDCLLNESPFEPVLDTLAVIADQTVGYYAGDFGRYRAAKLLGNTNYIDGIITAASMYENTGIVLNVLDRGFTGAKAKPILNLCFDGNKNLNDESKLETFLYYL